MTLFDIIFNYLKERGYSIYTHRCIHTGDNITITISGQWCKTRWSWITIHNEHITVASTQGNQIQGRCMYAQYSPAIHTHETLEIQDPNFFNKLEQHLPKPPTLFEAAFTIPICRLITYYKYKRTALKPFPYK